MDWFVVRHPETGGVGIVPESSLEHHRGRGWLRVSDALRDDERDRVDRASYVDAPDLDASEPEPESEPEPSAQAPAETPDEER